MHNVYVIMPIYHRADQANTAISRLRATAGIACSYIVVGGRNQIDNLKYIANAQRAHNDITVLSSESWDRLTYWQSLDLASKTLADDALMCAVASDVLPASQWLQRAYEWYNDHRTDDYMIGFNGDGWPEYHACHFMISKPRLQSVGGWPTWYDHNFGDTELCTRAREMNRFYKHPYSILYHNHPVAGGVSDLVYDIGQHAYHHDAELFQRRKANRWN